MSTDLTTQQQGSLIPTLASNAHATLTSFKEHVKTGKFFPYMKLYGSTTNEVKDRKIAAGHYGLNQNQTLIDLGESVIALVCNWRWKAVRIIGEEFFSYFDPNTDRFKEVQKLSAEPNSGCMYGPEFLLWLPSQKCFAVFHMNSNSARQEAQNVIPMVGKTLEFKWRLASSKKYKWEAPVVVGYSTAVELPDMTELEMVNNQFINPDDSSQSEASSEEASSVESDRR